jgi:hypothetical protein
MLKERRFPTAELIKRRLQSAAPWPAAETLSYFQICNLKSSESFREQAGRSTQIAICHLPFTIHRFEIRDSKFECGGIAQLVERQLCKLEVRGSNPLASSLRSQRQRRA